ncbi:unnamed protein product [Mytilus coruscus]|uniref:Uncharacterized protein n=1 Tax=Mytilus coruscus TaxID=42192 RepID=A0A6J8DQU8_MYTCO|nr:unnamed protein product [Mytilus coruscus]
MKSLISPAKDEIRLRPLFDRDSADKIWLLIHTIYDGDDSVSQLQQLFFQRNQKDDETLQDNSLNLMKIFDQINKRDNTVLGDKDKVLKDRFIEGFKEPHLKREGHKCPKCPSPFQAQRRDEDTQKTHTRGQFRGRGRGYRGRYNQRGNIYQGGGTVVPSDSEEQLSGILTLYNNSFDCEIDSPKISFVKIAGNSPVHIPGNSMKTVMCTTRQKDKTEKYCAVVQSLQGNQCSLPRNIMVVDSYAEISQRTVPVCMINIGLEDVWINQKTRVGTLHSASLIHEVSQDNIDIDIDQTQINVHLQKIDAAVCKQATTNIENNKTIQLNDLDIEQENLTHEK